MKKNLKNVYIYALFLLLIWGFYRVFFSLPAYLEEVVIKPLIWLLPIYIIVRKNKEKLSSLGITSKNLFPAIYLSLALGSIFAIEAIFLNLIKHGGFDFSANIGSQPFVFSLLLSFITAFSEEVSFRGFIFNRIWIATKNEWLANAITTTLWTLIHVPVMIFVLKLDLVSALTQLLITAIFGIGSAFLFARTKNVFSSVLLHVLWEWPIILFR